MRSTTAWPSTTSRGSKPLAAGKRPRSTASSRSSSPPAKAGAAPAISRAAAAGVMTWIALMAGRRSEDEADAQVDRLLGLAAGLGGLPRVVRLHRHRGDGFPGQARSD